MRPTKVVKISISALLFITTFFPIFIPISGDRAVNIYGLLLEFPLAFIVPVLFAGSILFAWFDTKWSSVQSAVLAMFGIIAAFVVNGFTNTETATPEPYTSIAMILYLLVTPIVYLCFLIRKIFRRARRNREQVEPKAASFLTMPIWRYALFVIVSGGLYHLYWYYANWSAVKLKEGSTISPFWRTAFWIFWIYPLFKRIIGVAHKRSQPVKFSAGLLATVYIAAMIFLMPLSFLLPYNQIWIVSLAAMTTFILLTIPVQWAANAQESTGNAPAKQPTAGESIIVALGALLFIMNISAIAKGPNITVLEDFRLQMSLVKKSFQLSADYAKCSDELSGQLKLLDQTSMEAVDAYNADYDRCEAVKVELDKAIKASETRSPFLNR